MAAASIITSVVTGGSNSHQTIAEELNAYASDFVSQGVVGTITIGSGSTAGTGSFAVTQDASPDLGVTILSGNAYVSGTPSGQDAQVLRARMTSNYTSYAINANSSGSTKYDWIYLQLSAVNANNPSSAADNVITLYTSRSSSNTSDNGAPPNYGLLLAVVTVANGASSITNSNIADRRTQVTLSAAASGSTTGWNSLGSYTLTYSANNGNKEFVVNTSSDLTGTLSPGMKLKVTRSVTPPTQCMSFTAASSQYATKASPTGITFTSAFTCEAWVYLNSYPTGAQGGSIIGRTDTTTGGFQLRINQSGQLSIYYAGSSNFTEWPTYQSVPLKRWVHVAGVVSSVASKTLQGLYINGTAVSNSTGSQTATTLVQTSNLSIGGAGAGVANSFFDGYISEARVWSVAQTQANIQANMGINLVGNETNLVALFQGNGNFNDATSNANNLTATNGAIATQAANPYNAIEYANIRAISSTQLTLFTDDYGTIPNQTLNSPQYSVSTEPYGWPRNLISDKTWGYIIWCSNVTTTATATGTQLSGASITLTVPTGGKKFILKAITASLLPAAGVAVLQAFNGANQVSQANSSSNAAVTLSSYPFVAPAGSQTFTLDLYETSAGTCTFGATTVAPAMFAIEEA